MTNSVTHVIPKIARICGYGITALTVAFLLEMVFEIMYQYYVKNLKTLWHTATYVYNSPLRCTLQHLADDIENS